MSAAASAATGAAIGVGSASRTAPATSAVAPASLEGPVLQRHFFHAKIKHPGGTAALPVVLILQHDDVRVLSEHLSAVIKDVLWILQEKAALILPNASQPAPKVYNATAVFHGHIISASFEVREAEANYGVMEIPAAGVVAAGRDSGGCLIDVPVTGFRLFAYVRHKESELARRTARLKPTSLDAYISGGATAGSGKAAGAGAGGAGPASKPRATSAGAKRGTAAPAAALVAPAVSSSATAVAASTGAVAKR